MVELGLSVGEFWALTPREFVKMTRRYRQRERHADYRAAVVALPLLNWGAKKHQLTEPGDIFSSLKKRAAGPEHHGAALQSWASMGFGKLKRKSAA
ncbi:MAG TPA: hypothetical protein VK973_00845 [Arenicellales bacterium]|nr:hypothetical protein [Arenicellales bacterium]